MSDGPSCSDAPTNDDYSLLGLVSEENRSVLSCSSTLIQKTTVSNSNFTKLYSYLSQMTEDQWNSTYGQGGLQFGMDGLEIGASYSETKQFLSNISNYVSEYFSESEQKSLLISELDPGGVEAYKACINGNKGTPLLLWMQSKEDDIVHIWGTWSPVGAGQAALKELKVFPKEEFLGFPPNPGQNSLFKTAFRRDKSKPLYIQIQAVLKNGETYDDSIVIPKKIELSYRYDRKLRSSDEKELLAPDDKSVFYFVGNSGEQWVDRPFSFYAKKGYTIRDKSATASQVIMASGFKSAQFLSIDYNKDYISGVLRMTHAPHVSSVGYGVVSWVEERVEVLVNGSVVNPVEK